MRRQRLALAIAATLSATLWAYACGDGATEPMSPPPDPPRPTTVTVTPAMASLTAIGATVQMSAHVLDQNGQAMAGAAVTWTSSAAAVATVDGSGLVMAVTNGTATITAAAGGVSGTAALMVEQMVSAVTVEPAADTLVAGDTLRLSAEAADGNGHTVTGAEFEWASSDTLVAVVDSSGLVTGITAGAATVAATSSGVAGGAEITVVAPVPAAVAVAPDTVRFMAIGQTAQFAAEVRDQAGRLMEGAAVSWSSADTMVATVDSAGVATATGSGTATVTATAGEARGEAVVTVVQSAGSVTVSPPADTMAPGDTLRLVAEAFDGNGHRVDGAMFDWSSSNVSVARVDDSGLVQAVAEGSATITAAAGNVRGSAEITVEKPDRAALVALYNATDGPNWVDNDGWLTDAPLGEWYGVHTDEDGRVVRLDLSGTWDREAREDKVHGLSGPIPPELGNLANLEALWLYSNHLSGPIPSELGNLASVQWVNLEFNDLSGSIPPELGNLANLRSLQLDGNSLTGSVPRSFLQLGELRSFDFSRVGNESLCVPGTSEFYAWLQRIGGWIRLARCNAVDVAVLTRLFEATGGSGWTRSDGWLDDFVLGGWHGVSADTLGRVTALDLSGNGLTGKLPRNLGEMSELVRLRIGDNTLSGRLPLSLTGLPLLELHYEDTQLCAAPDASFRAWLDAIASHEGTGLPCAPLSDREILEALYETTNGPEWRNNENWLTGAELGTWHGVRVDHEGRVVALRLFANNLHGTLPRELGKLTQLRSLSLARTRLEGTIPPELGELANLTSLWLYTTALKGAIPPELGNLGNLEELGLFSNNLTGTIPSELGNLGKLGRLILAQNDLEGAIPPELGNLSRLLRLNLGDNGLSGTIPAELGNLGDLSGLSLAGNDLAGSLPPELGNLVNLQQLYLAHNELTGPVPSEFGNLAALEQLGLSGNVGLAGALPSSLARLGSLEALHADDTGLCAPSDARLLQWLDHLPNSRVALCEGGEPATAYLVQAVQSRRFPVPLVAGEEALLRVFFTAGRANQERFPPVRASFHVNGALAHVAEIAEKPGPIPADVDEGSLATSVNSVVPANVVQPGLEIVIEIDPEGTLDASLEVARRIPETGRMPVDVQAVPLFDLTLIPFIWTETHDRSIVDLIRAMAADPYGHAMFGDVHLLPIGEMQVTAHEPVLSSSNNVYTLLSQTSAIRAMEGGTGHYKGMMSQPVTGAAGVAYRPGRSSFSRPDPSTVAHELGHNLSLPHAPCGDPEGPDPLFPYPDGSIGAWGYDARVRGRPVHPSTPDLMSYCGPSWMSDYNFSKALRFRLTDEGDVTATMTAAATSLLLWGAADSVGVPHLEPAFVVDAPPALPQSGGDYRITGSTEGGAELFALSFGMPELADGDGSSSFAFVLPVRTGWEDNLASITLTGPGGTFTLDGDSDIPMAILRNPRTGQVRGILRDLPPANQAAMDAAAGSAGPGLEVLFSRGIPRAKAWRR